MSGELDKQITDVMEVINREDNYGSKAGIRISVGLRVFQCLVSVDRAENSNGLINAQIVHDKPPYKLRNALGVRQWYQPWSSTDAAAHVQDILTFLRVGKCEPSSWMCTGECYVLENTNRKLR